MSSADDASVLLHSARLTLLGLLLLSSPMAVLVANSRMLLDSLPPMPFRALLSALFRVSLAFTSTGVKPSSLHGSITGIVIQCLMLVWLVTYAVQGIVVCLVRCVISIHLHRSEAHFFAWQHHRCYDSVLDA